MQRTIFTTPGVNTVLRVLSTRFLRWTGWQIAGEAPAAVVRVPTLKMGDALIANRRILADQMEFLTAHLPRNSRLAA
jgi:hypothetical protein